MISKEALDKLKSQKDPLLKECYSEFIRLVESPYLESYITLYSQIEDFNEQLTIKSEETKQKVVGTDLAGNTITVDWTPGKIDLFADKEDKSFDRSWKYMLEVSSLLESLNKIRSLMSPEKQIKAEEMRKINKASGVAV